jgi:protease I
MPGKLDGMKVALLVTHGFEQSELTEPKKALDQEGARTFVVSPSTGAVRGWKHGEWGDNVRVDVTLDSTRAADYGALVLPAGVMNPDYLRWNKRVVEFVKGFFDAGKPIAAICHGPWTLIDAGVVQNRKVTSWPSLRTDLKNAGAHWVDEEVVVDDGLVTSRKPDDLPVFNQKIIEEFAKYRTQRQSAQARAS